MKDEEKKPVNLKRHRQYEFISPKYLFRVFLTIVAMGFLLYMVFDLFEHRQTLSPDNTNSPDSTTTEIEVAIDSLK